MHAQVIDWQLAYEADMRDVHARVATDAAQRLREVGLAADSTVRVGQPVAAVVEEARTWGADLVVVGSRGARGLRRMLLGSVARGVVAEAESSVLVVRPPVAAAPDAIGRDEARERSVIPA
jgi:nucleotide-binding universal stress UspA family protein